MLVDTDIGISNTINVHSDVLVGDAVAQCDKGSCHKPRDLGLSPTHITFSKKTPKVSESLKTVRHSLSRLVWNYKAFVKLLHADAFTRNMGWPVQANFVES